MARSCYQDQMTNCVDIAWEEEAVHVAGLAELTNS